MLDRSSSVNSFIDGLSDQWVTGCLSLNRTKRKIPLPHTPEGGFVTICVAAIAGGDCVYGASDRMLTSLDIEFEPPTTESKPIKTIPLTNSIVAMIAGDDISLLTQLIHDLNFIVSERVKKEPANWWTVSDVAHQYRDLYTFKKNQTIERRILSPRGLSYENFIGRQKEINEALLMKIDSEIGRFKFPPLSVIFAGVDPSGAHLFVARDGEITCEDLVGFAAIGSGYWHAESYFMAQGHTPNSPIHRGVYLTYAAKRRAEIAPGVGTGIDMFLIGPRPGSYSPIRQDVMSEFEKTYEKARKSAKKVWENEEGAMKALLAKLSREAEAQAKKQEGQMPEGGNGTPKT